MLQYKIEINFPPVKLMQTLIVYAFYMYVMTKQFLMNLIAEELKMNIQYLWLSFRQHHLQPKKQQ